MAVAQLKLALLDKKTSRSQGFVICDISLFYHKCCLQLVMDFDIYSGSQ
jgi:hypothetical protein